jgi:replicative DNA helicase
MGENAFSLGKWLPTLGIKLRSLVPGELVFFIGDTGTGKTGILQQVAKAALPLPTLMFELELPKEMMFERFASMSSRLTGEQVEQAYQSSDDSIAEQLGKHYDRLLICPVARLSVKQMEEIIMRSELKLGERPRVVLIDYIQLIKGDGENRREKISDIAEELKVIAKATRTIVIVASQISRPKDVDKDWEPSLHSAKESGSIEASCGLLISAWKDTEDEGALNLRVLKSTKGGTGTFVKCNFDGARMIITERSRVSDTDVPGRD